MHPGKNIRLFKSDLLERFTYVHPLMPIGLWGPVVAFSFYYGLRTTELDIARSLILAGAGLVFWSFAEYVLHRFVFHFKPRSATQERISFLIHGIHHDDPMDQRRLLMPPLAAILIAIPFYAAFSATLGPVNANPFFAGFIAGYLCYDYIHFGVHYWNFKSKYFKTLKHNHMQHHFVKPDARYGVSGTLWDYVFKTRG